ncbi:PREDICTED: F-box/LRR-repeat [Prunus dulcis]|uniref:PREDICTED: F-box/LRR-repeat n=1 Tax=Prunus dulcis TaxID=3755 RepID=A0A5E4FC96_PRUDU|nr:hypothetical protein L3X38_002695 [Prunus dulcis]VVA25477.1 PREDICTED: F-box/LRR-repeat [Prunus dulcis]
MESLLLDVPFECRSWYKASLDPSCWQCLIFPRFNYYRFDHVRGFYIDTRFWFLTLFYRKFVYRYLTGKLRFSMNGFLKLVVSRSCGNATSLSLPECSDQILKYVANADCRGFEEDDDDILKLASHIAYFSCEGSELYDSEDNHGRLISDGESSDDD